MNTRTQIITICKAILTAIVLLLLFSTTLDAQQQTGVSATAGKEFYVSCLTGGVINNKVPELQLKVVVEKACYITAKYNNINRYWKNWDNAYVQPGIYTEDMSYTDMANAVTGVSTKTMTVTSTEDISVYAINFTYASTDASTILPTSTWGTEYRLATADSYDVHFPNYAVVAKEDRTEVRLPDNNIVMLDKNEAYHYHAKSAANLTGQKISSSKPVAVYSGNALAIGIGQGNALCDRTVINLGPSSQDHCYEQLWSTDKWGKDFFVWPVPTYSPTNWGGIMVIVANEDNTNITVSGAINGGTPLKYKLNAGGKQHVCYNMKGLCKVESDKPVMVFTVLPDAAITYIPPVNQRVLKATLSPFILSGVSNITSHAVEMLIPAAYWNKTVIKEDNKIVPNTNYTALASPDFPDWYTVRRDLANKDVKIEVYCPGGLLAYMYGYGAAETYGYLASSAAYNLRSYFTIQESVTTADSYYKNTTETTHTFDAGDELTVKRTVEGSFDYVKWSINGKDQTVAENGAMLNTLKFPASKLVPGENSLTMAIRFRNTNADSLYTGKVWLQGTPLTSSSIDILSYGDAPASYDTAAHYLTDKLYLGAIWDSAKVQAKPVPSVNANTAGNDDALTLTATNEYTDLNQPGLTLNAAGQLTSTFDLANNTSLPANLQGWIDFNRNDVFDAGEASLPLTVSANSGNSRQTLVWDNAADRIMHGITYMRLRLSTEAITQPADTLADGEVEDYMLNLKILDVSKTAESNNQGTTARVTLLDTLTYTVKVSNPTNVPLTNITVFDPIPLHTEYVDNSASPAGTLENMNVNGQALKVIKWAPIAVLNAGDEQSFSFKVTITDMPYLHDPNDSVIFNIAYAAIHGDSIPSTSHTCMLAGIVADSLQAVDDDAASIFSGNVSVIDVLGNDHLGQCSKSTILVEILVPPKSGAMVIIEQDKTLRYVSSPAFSGNDSLVYKITGNGTVSTAKVRIKVTAVQQTVRDEHIYLFSCQTKTANILTGDPSLASGTFTLRNDGSRGTASFNGNAITYANDKTPATCSTHGGKVDTVKYVVCNPVSGDCYDANLIVHILRTPRILIADSCSRRPYLQSDLQYKNSTYQWHKSTDNGTSWSPVANATDKKLYVTEDALYKLEVKYRGDTIETVPAHFIVRKQTKMPNGAFWYDTMIN